jgi:hypothetical protein
MAFTLGVALGVASCTTTPSADTGGTNGKQGISRPTLMSTSSLASAGPTLLARALAVALKSTDARLIVANTLRSSNYTEHKVSLRDFLLSDAAADIRRSVGRSLRLRPGGMEHFLDTIPNADLYMVAQIHRRTWLADAPVLVAAQMSHSPPPYGFASGGQQVPLDLGIGVLPATALLLIEAAEPKEVMAVIRDPANLTIEGATEGQLKQGRVAYTICDPESDPGCEDGGGGGGGGGGGDSPLCTDYRLRGVATFNLIDNGNPFEGNEIEVHAWDGTHGDYARVTGLAPTDSRSVDLDIYCTTGTVTFTAKETDGPVQPDDNFTLPFPHTVLEFTLGNGTPTFLWTWPNQLDPLYFDPKVSVRVEW